MTILARLLAVLALVVPVITIGVASPALAIPTTMANGWTQPLDSMNAADGFLADGCGAANNYPVVINGVHQFHNGADFWGAITNGVRLGGDSVYGIGHGTVKKSGASFGSGNGYVAMVEYTAPDLSTFVVVYGHLKSTGQPAVGSTVNAGDLIGTLDPSVPSGAHLHLGVRPGAYSTMPTTNWGNQPCPVTWPPSVPSGTNGFVDPMPFLNAHAVINTTSSRIITRVGSNLYEVNLAAAYTLISNTATATNWQLGGSRVALTDANGLWLNSSGASFTWLANPADQVQVSSTRLIARGGSNLYDVTSTGGLTLISNTATASNWQLSGNRVAVNDSSGLWVDDNGAGFTKVSNPVDQFEVSC